MFSTSMYFQELYTTAARYIHASFLTSFHVSSTPPFSSFNLKTWHLKIPHLGKYSNLIAMEPKLPKLQLYHCMCWYGVKIWPEKPLPSWEFLLIQITVQNIRLRGYGIFREIKKCFLFQDTIFIKRTNTITTFFEEWIIQAHVLRVKSRNTIVNVL